MNELHRPSALARRDERVAILTIITKTNPAKSIDYHILDLWGFSMNLQEILLLLSLAVPIHSDIRFSKPNLFDLEFHFSKLDRIPLL
jgi:hypothetical protein